MKRPILDTPHRPNPCQDKHGNRARPICTEEKDPVQIGFAWPVIAVSLLLLLLGIALAHAGSLSGMLFLTAAGVAAWIPTLENQLDD